MSDQFSFTEAEAREKIGKRIISACDISNGLANVASGAHGEIVDIVKDHHRAGECYLVVIEWANMAYDKRKIGVFGALFPEKKVDWHMNKSVYERFLREEA